MKIYHIVLNLLVYLLRFTFTNEQLAINNELGSGVERLNEKSQLFSEPDKTKFENNMKSQMIFNLSTIPQKSKRNEENVRDKRAVVNVKNLKWPNTIYYTVIPPVNATIVKKGLDGLMKETCIRFKKVPKLNGLGLRYFKGEGCWSLLGKQVINEPQSISLGKDCGIKAAVQHETFHALGVEHEMARGDRNKYLTLYPHYAGNYFREAIGYDPSHKTYKIRYDYGSIMHYHRLALSKKGKFTIVPRNLHYLKTIGQTNGASFNDFKLLNLHYCNDICKKKLKCLNYGYTDPNNCNVCKCPAFFRGIFCGKLTKSQRNCPKQELFSKVVKKRLLIHGIKSCIIRITAPKGSKIRLQLVNSNFPFVKLCRPYNGLEIKFLRDKSVAGIRFCGMDKNKNIVSEGSTIIMHYRGFKKKNRVNIEYRTIH